MIKRILAHESIAAAVSRGRSEYKKLSLRERGIIWSAAAIGALIGLYSFGEHINGIFAEQHTRLEDGEKAVRATGPLLERYVKLKTRRDAIEREYRGVEIKEGAYAHIENLIRSKLGISSGFTIKDNPPKEMGGDFEQITYSIKFPVPTLQPLIDFLKEIVHGQRPLLLSRLDIAKRGRGDKLEIELDVVSIREAHGGGAAPKEG